MINVAFSFHWYWIPLVLVAAALAAGLFYSLAMVLFFCCGGFRL